MAHTHSFDYGKFQCMADFQGNIDNGFNENPIFFKNIYTRKHSIRLLYHNFDKRRGFVNVREHRKNRSKTQYNLKLYKIIDKIFRLG